MIRHVTLMNFKSGTDAAAREAVLQAYRQLPAHIPQIRAWSVGLDLGLLEGNAALAIVGEFASREDFLLYSQHPAQMAVIFPVCGHVMESYSTAQFELP
jgi:hypothetical protein